ncbi:DUF305 domain-containing protein [Gordonia sp. OPL2]|uniref:DUF305 domain-containing protein n=1 Tax=Gordonia sp. OPL2 TaxID=2486274 RepID=UPI0016562194|nr:DUF305 domain-containing protein [Gordonia sp. OPL2]ROZ88901.1 DUF305 domain-containing protein [Gordonia sp. OPL2]
MTEPTGDQPSSSAADADAVEHTTAPDPAAGNPRPDTSRRTLLATLGVVATLLIGMGLGLLISAMLHSDDPAADEVPASDSVAVGFAQDMIRHHEQGVEMATIELENGSDPQVRSMAFDILTAQSNEIGQMQSWLTRWGYPVINPNPTMAWMGHEDHAGAGHGDSGPDTGHGTDGHGTDKHAGHDMSDMPGMPAPSTSPPTPTAEAPPMPGMATTAEMNRLRSLRGAEADVYFLQLMLRHHEGGMPMMQYAADPANVSQDYVRALATAMEQTQTKEISVIQQMLAERNAAPLPMN